MLKKKRRPPKASVLDHLDIQVKRFVISWHYFLGEDTGGRNDSGYAAPSISTPYGFAGFKRFDPTQLLVDPRESIKRQGPAGSSKNGTNEGEGL